MAIVRERNPSVGASAIQGLLIGARTGAQIGGQIDAARQRQKSLEIQEKRYQAELARYNDQLQKASAKAAEEKKFREETQALLGTQLQGVRSSMGEDPFIAQQTAEIQEVASKFTDPKLAERYVQERSGMLKAQVAKNSAQELFTDIEEKLGKGIYQGGAEKGAQGILQALQMAQENGALDQGLVMKLAEEHNSILEGQAEDQHKAAVEQREMQEATQLAQMVLQSPNLPQETKHAVERELFRAQNGLLKPREFSQNFSRMLQDPVSLSPELGQDISQMQEAMSMGPLAKTEPPQFQRDRKTHLELPYEERKDYLIALKTAVNQGGVTPEVVDQINQQFGVDPDKLSPKDRRDLISSLGLDG